MTHLRRLLAALIITLPTASTLAADTTYTIDPTRSRLTLSGTWGSTPLAPITDPSILNPIIDNATGLTDSYAGNITANRDLQQNTLQITTASVLAQDGGFTLLLSDSNPPPNYAVANTTTTNIYGVLHGLVLSLLTPTISSPASFNTSQLTATVTAGQFSYATISRGGPTVGIRVPSLITTTDFGFTDVAETLSFDPATATLADANGTETLTIPIETTIDIQADGEPLTMHLSGTLIATASVPEPASLVLLAITTPFLLLRRSLAAPQIDQSRKSPI